MIIGKLVSADGGNRHKSSRKCRLLPEKDRIEICSFIESRIVNQKDWFCSNDIFKNIPEDLFNTPLIRIYEACKKKYPERDRGDLNSIVKKNLGIYLRDSLNSSKNYYEEQFLSSIKQYRRVNNG